MALIEEKPNISPYPQSDDSVLSGSSALFSVTHRQAAAIANCLWNLYGLLDLIDKQCAIDLQEWKTAINADHDAAREVHDSLVNLCLSLELKRREEKNE